MALLTRLALIIAATLCDLPLPLGFPFVSPIERSPSALAASLPPVRASAIGSDQL